MKKQQRKTKQEYWTCSEIMLLYTQPCVASSLHFSVTLFAAIYYFFRFKQYSVQGNPKEMKQNLSHKDNAMQTKTTTKQKTKQKQTSPSDVIESDCTTQRKIEENGCEDICGAPNDPCSWGIGEGDYPRLSFVCSTTVPHSRVEEGRGRTPRT